MKKWLIRITFIVLSLCLATTEVFAEEISLKDVHSQLNHIFGARRVDMLNPQQLLADELTAVLGGPPGPFIVPSPDLSMYSACRPNSCYEKGTVLVDKKSKRLRGIAIAHFNCHAGDYDKVRKRRAAVCDQIAKVNVFLFGVEQNSTQEEQVLAPIREWEKDFEHTGESIEIVN